MGEGFRQEPWWQPNGGLLLYSKLGIIIRDRRGGYSIAGWSEVFGVDIIITDIAELATEHLTDYFAA